MSARDYTVFVCQFDIIPEKAKNSLINDFVFTPKDGVYHVLIYETSKIANSNIENEFTGQNKILKKYAQRAEDTLKPVMFSPSFEIFKGLNQLFSPFIFSYFGYSTGMLNSGRTISVFESVVDYFHIDLVPLDKVLHFTGLRNTHTENDVMDLLSISGVSNQIENIVIDSEKKEALVFLDSVETTVKVMKTITNCHFDGGLIRISRLDGIRYVSELTPTRTAIIDDALLL